MAEVPRKTIVTFFEEYGAGADYVAPRVALRLAVPYAGQRFSSDRIEAAEAREEREETALGRFFKSFTPIAVADADITWAMDAMGDRDGMEANTREVLEAVRNGGVIFGRSSTKILADQPGALHVKLIGPREDRIDRATRLYGIDREKAEKRQLREDRVRVDLSRQSYRWDPTDDSNYDLVLNTGTFDLDACVDVIVAAYRGMYGT